MFTLCKLSVFLSDLHNIPWQEQHDKMVQNFIELVCTFGAMTLSITAAFGYYPFHFGSNTVFENRYHFSSSKFRIWEASLTVTILRLNENEKNGIMCLHENVNKSNNSSKETLIWVDWGEMHKLEWVYAFLLKLAGNLYTLLRCVSFRKDLGKVHRAPWLCLLSTVTRDINKLNLRHSKNFE